MSVGLWIHQNCVNGGGIMRQSGGVKMYHGLVGSLSP